MARSERGRGGTKPRDASLLQLFARYPEAGFVKTRLAAAIGDRAACDVHEELLERTARCLLEASLGPVELWLDRAGTHPLLDRLLAGGIEGPRVQRGEDLGARMYAALAQGLRRAERVILVGSDCPGIDENYLAAAARALAGTDLVFGPAEDGGYVLVGCRLARAAAFSGVDWGTGRVLEQSCAAARAAGLTVTLLEPRYDVDTPEDLRRWRGA